MTLILSMNYDYLERLKQGHSAWKLLAAESSPLVISFLEMVFIKDNKRAIKESVLTERLHDFLLYIRSIHGENKYTRSAAEYLENWSQDTHGWIRKYYPQIGDEAEFDITPATEKVIEWLKSFEQKEFIGTESRLLLIFQMMRNLAHETEEDPKKRITDLENKKEEIDEEIRKINSGVSVGISDRQVKENLWRLEDEMRNLMSDFRQVEENFRTLDRQTREKIATSRLSKSELLDEIFMEHDTIGRSEQGKSFAAFWNLLMSRKWQSELEENILVVNALYGPGDTASRSIVTSMKYNLLDSGDRAKKILANLNEQLRTFLDEKLWIENKRIMDLIQSVEEKAIEVRNSVPRTKDFLFIDYFRPDIDLLMERKLYSPPDKPFLVDEIPEIGFSKEVPEVLLSQHFVAEERLRQNIRHTLSGKSQVSLGEICEKYPPQKGLSEIITYLSIANREKNSFIETTKQEKVLFEKDGIVMEAIVPLTLFTI